MMMKRTLPMLAWGLAGVLLIAGLTTAAVAAAGKDISPPTSRLPFVANRVEPAAGETPGSHGQDGKDDHGPGASQGPAGDDHAGNSGSSQSSGSGSGDSGSGSGVSQGSGESSGGSGDSGEDHSGEGGGGDD